MAPAPATLRLHPEAEAYPIDPAAEAAFLAEESFTHRLLDELEAGAGVELTDAEFAELVRGLAPDLTRELPLPTRPELLTADCNARQEWPGDPRPAIDVYAERIAAGFQAKHPGDVYVHDLLDFGVVAHTTATGNSEVVWGELISLRGAA